MRPRGPSAIFTPARGQFDNIGDIILRRQLLSWLPEGGTRHIYTGRSPTGYDRGLGLSADDVIYRSFLRWYLSGFGSALRGDFAYVAKPGELQLSWSGMKEHLAILPILAVARLRHRPIVRIGAGLRNFSSPFRWIMSPVIKWSQPVYWRDDASTEYLGRGSTMPDLAFAEGGVDDELTATTPHRRKLLVVSMRGDRPMLPAAAIDAIKEFAEQSKLEILVMTQVGRDNARSLQLANALDSPIDGWDGRDHDLREEHLRVRFRHAALVVSDRLHVLIAAVSEGAAIAGLSSVDSDKIDRHCSAAGLQAVSLPLADGTVATIVSGLMRSARRRADQVNQVIKARQRLQQVRGEVERELAGRSRSE